MKTPIGPTTVHSNGKLITWVSGLQIDADGAPQAYHPTSDKLALDYLANAGHPGNWWGVVTDNNQPDGTPVIQGPNDPAPGFCISPTSLQDKTFGIRDPRRYVDSSTVPYIAMPKVLKTLGANLGNLVLVCNLATGQWCAALVADIGPSGKIGEGSVALAQAIGVNPSAKKGGASKGICFVVFPGSGRWPMTAAELDSTVANLKKAHGLSIKDLGDAYKAGAIDAALEAMTA